MAVEWDPAKARVNLRKHGSLRDAVLVLKDEMSVMKKEYDFRDGRRGAVVNVAPDKTRVTIRLDNDVLDWFRQQVDDAGSGNYQTFINDALRSFMHQKQEPLESTLRRVIRDELRRTG